MIGKMMKTVLNKLRRDDTGQAFILVLILLLLGGLIMAPLLGFMGTGLKAGQAYEQRMAELYAADGGIEDAIWKVTNNQIPDEDDQPYHLTVNNKDVAVTVPSRHDTAIALLKQIGALDPQGQGDYNKAAPNSEWMLIYKAQPSGTDPTVYNTYEITINYNPEQPNQKRRITNLGCWINGLKIDDDTPATVVGGDLLGVTYEHPIVEGSVPPYPTFDDFVPKPSFESNVYFGTAFIWEWQPAKGPEFTSTNNSMKVTFSFDPGITVEAGEQFPGNFAWARSQSDDIFISWSGSITGFSNIVSVATSLSTNKSTTVTSYVFTEAFPDGSVLTTILTWEADLQ